ncbi:MBL fold metallo-hydrolase [Candidatus Thiosymbion oneisti]|uniref:MBL fold metallo-hydrolase n=1 Tax=Candidatus Thiosymbion oneisti TaxID=589554 RepID=UPI000B7CA707|nr:MBL fold metallo-hydrolase [Candidatus Thiosymbion oneisti]
MRFKIIPVTLFQQNCTLLWCDETGHAAVVDPGGETTRVLAAIQEAEVEPVKILLTHGHLDHVGGAAELAERLDLPIEGPHRGDEFLLKSLAAQSQLFGVPEVRGVSTGRWLEDGDSVRIGALELRVIHCPGHSPGHVVFFNETARLAQVGDVLFQGSIGRTDLPRGNHQNLVDSIRRCLFPLGDDVWFIPGHGPMSSFGDERRNNPFVRDPLV